VLGQVHVGWQAVLLLLEVVDDVAKVRKLDQLAIVLLRVSAGQLELILLISSDSNLRTKLTIGLN
jgi:hypothetical protein